MSRNHGNNKANYARSLKLINPIAQPPSIINEL
jgi:hypothetical protein